MDATLSRLLDLLDSLEGGTVGTSVRLPIVLRDAATVATQLGLIGSTSELTAHGLRAALDAVAQRAVLDAHYEQYPQVRPDLAEISLAAAELDGHPLAAQPELIRCAADELARIVDDPTPDEVLAYAAGRAAAA